MRLSVGLLLVLCAFLSPSVGDKEGCDPFLVRPQQKGPAGQLIPASPCAVFSLQPGAKCSSADLPAGRTVVVLQSAHRRNSTFTFVQVMPGCQLTYFRPRSEKQYLLPGVHDLEDAPPSQRSEFTLTAYYCTCSRSPERVRRRAGGRGRSRLFTTLRQRQMKGKKSLQ
ncbi:hypothetical protein NDU88_000345 [Pleurodeles waltl]|uniref:Uncharacterized protein n=1 Tax=Pleurodeles waltl TaxID=8319 RepID=A0AAV7KP79_PLEWA|nr:hypothetical protein NDU88_000345 [Pleurodeles waltl]